MALTFKLWARIEVYDSETDEHTDLNPESCEYSIAESSSVKELAQFIVTYQNCMGIHDDEVQQEIVDALNHQGFVVEDSDG
jgi:hypothetical protein